MREPKIVFVNRYFHPDQSATSQLLTDLASALANTGREVHVVCSRQRYDDPAADLAPRENVARVAVHRVWTTRFGRTRLLGRAVDYGTFYISSAIVLTRLLKRDDTVIAKTDPPLISIVAMIAASLKGAFLVNWLQDIFPEVASLLGANPLPSAVDAMLRRFRDGSLRFARANVVLGERMRDRVLGAGLAVEKVRIIENWAEMSPQDPRAAALSSLRRRLALDDRFVVGYSGNLGRAHEYKTLLGASEVLRDDPSFMFLMIGGGAGMTELRRTAAERGLDNFRFLPYQPRESLCDCLAASDVHWLSLLPCLEGLIVPSKLYGILAAARPAIFVGDPDGELARIVTRTESGCVVRVGDVAGLVEVLRRYKSDRQELERMGRNGYLLYQERYTAGRALRQWQNLLSPDRSANPANAAGSETEEPRQT